ncbi:Aste57867_18394 [Aphanomyces stellatus]|uniref:Aste57867_18394 protein n=1 Tax=Aphanomyces stellatus TaxID=120398 RepID=A0A485LBE7_9STRA|nr:hypothetical protein As57867_018332 [Aphanomyces stellatus]VFT95130.1 Aste57867_18394 [Aphanomyces stellatus]
MESDPPAVQTTASTEKEDMRKLVHSRSYTKIDIDDQPQPEVDTFSQSSSSSRSDSDVSDDEESSATKDDDENSSLLHEQHAPTCLAQQLWKPFRTLVMNPLSTFLFFALVNTIFIVLWAFFALIASVITRPGLVLLFAASAIAIARFAALLIAYPGHIRVVTRDCERSFAKMTKRWLTLTTDTTDELIDILQSPVPLDPRALAALLTLREDYRSCIQNIVTILRRSLEIVDAEETLTADGKLVLSRVRVFLEYADTIQKPLMQLFAPRGSDAAKQSFRLPPLAATLVDFKTCNQDLRDAIQLMGEPSSTPKRSGLVRLVVELWKSRSPFSIVANLSLMRADLIARYNGVQEWVESRDGHLIDGMFIPGLGLPNTHANTERTVLLCNPNCGLYEFHHFQSDWIQFYTKYGVNVFVFNYRGYGRCKGYPSPSANNMDGMAVVAHLKARGITRLAVHGESIGGMVATHVAKNAPGIEVLVADRTFANLPAVAQRLVASWAGSALSCVTRWQTDNVANYLDAPCHKVLCCDPCDEIIADASSLKAGIALRLELGDLTLDAPPTPTSSSRGAPLLSPCASIQSHGRLDDDESVVVVVAGEPLTEAMVAQFTSALESIADRARQAVEQDGGMAIDLHPDEKRIVDVWSAVASVDGHCGQTLFYAAGGGLESVRTWIASFLVWGPSRTHSQLQHPETKTEPRRHDIVTPLGIDQVLLVLQRILGEAPGLREDKDVLFVVDVVEYLHAALAKRLKKKPEDELLNIGMLVPLNCGHNANFSEREKEAFVAHLVSFRWLEPIK